MRVEYIIEDVMGGIVESEQDGQYIVKPNRTCALDLDLAIEAVDELLAKYSKLKQDETGALWRAQSVAEHLIHAQAHVAEGLSFLSSNGEEGQEEDLASTACRALMALQLWREQQEKFASGS